MNPGSLLHTLGLPLAASTLVPVGQELFGIYAERFNQVKQGYVLYPRPRYLVDVPRYRK